MKIVQHQFLFHYSEFVKRFLFSILMILFFVAFAQAQSQSKNSSDYSKDPVWIKMMDDTKVNYYEALNAYAAYWKSHAMPSGEAEEEGLEGKGDFKEREREIKKEIRKEQSVKLSEAEIKKKNEDVEMKYQVKRFQQWAREVKPFVQEDGRILSDRERMQIYNKQQEEMKQKK